MPTQKPLVLVLWNDAWVDDDNFSTAHGIATTHGPMPVQTLGWLVHDDELGVSVANEQSTQDGHDVFRGRTFVPRAMIQSVTPYKLTKPRAAPKKSPQTDSISVESPS